MSRRTSRRVEKGTALGTELNTWALWRAMSDPAKVFWLTLYASGHARGRCPIGLWKGGPAVMAEEHGRDIGTVSALLAELQDVGAVEYDAAAQVARLVELPDRCERPHNGDVLRGWWNKFVCLPACPVRDRHVATLRWLVGTFTRDHQEAWDETFGQLEAAQRAHGVGHRVGSADSGHLVHRVPHGVGHRQGEGEGEGSGSASGSGSPTELIADLDRARGGAQPVPDDPLAELDPERSAEVLRNPVVADVVRRSLARFGPRAAGGGGRS